MNPKEIASRFPSLKAGEVAFVSYNGILFSKGSEADRERYARAHSFRIGKAYEKVVGVALETEKEVEEEIIEEVKETKTPTKKNSKK